MNNLLLRTMKYDLYGGIIFSLILFALINWKIAGIYFLGLSIALINFLVSGISLEYFLSTDKGIWIPISYILRILIIILVAIPFIKNLYELITYLGGYLSHFVFLILCWMKKEKGSD